MIPISFLQAIQSFITSVDSWVQRISVENKGVMMSMQMDQGKMMGERRR